MDKIGFKEKVASRKFLLMFSIFAGSTFLVMLPALINLLAAVELAVMLTGGEYATIILGTFATYAGANVYQKKAVPLVGTDEDS